MARFQGWSTRFLASAAAAGILALSAASCKTLGLPEETGAIGATASPVSDNDWRHESELWGARYKANPRDSDAAIRYAQALRATSQRSQAVAVLEQASIPEPSHKSFLPAPGPAPAPGRNYDQTVNPPRQTHTPDPPAFRILSAPRA